MILTITCKYCGSTFPIFGNPIKVLDMIGNSHYFCDQKCFKDSFEKNSEVETWMRLSKFGTRTSDKKYKK